MEIYNNIYNLSFRGNWKKRSLEELLNFTDPFFLPSKEGEKTIEEKLLEKYYKDKIIKPLETNTNNSNNHHHSSSSSSSSGCVSPKKKVKPTQVLTEETFICNGCEEENNKDDGFYVEGEGLYYCESCYIDNYFTCDCGEIVHLDNSYVAFDKYYCESCFNDMYFVCSNCSEVENNEEGWHTHYGNLICHSCYEEYYFTCVSCDEVYNNDDTIHTEDTEEDLCPTCAEPYVKQCYECGKYYNEIAYPEIELTSNNFVDLCEHCYTKLKNKNQLKLFEQEEE